VFNVRGLPGLIVRKAVQEWQLVSEEDRKALMIAPTAERWPKSTSMPTATRIKGQKRHSMFQVLHSTMPRLESSSRMPSEINIIGQKKDLCDFLLGLSGSIRNIYGKMA